MEFASDTESLAELAFAQRQIRVLPGQHTAFQVIYRLKTLFSECAAETDGLISGAAVDNERPRAKFLKTLSGVVIILRHVYGIYNMPVTVVLVIAHVDQNGVFVIQHAGGVEWPDFHYTTDALLYLTGNQQDDNAGQCCNQQDVVANKLAELVDIHLRVSCGAEVR